MITYKQAITFYYSNLKSKLSFCGTLLTSNGHLAQDEKDISNINQIIENALPIFKLIFSIVVLMPISVIIAGKLLSQIFTLKVVDKQYFKVPLVMLHIQATDDEVIWGFIGFIVTLVLFAAFIGETAQIVVKEHFGMTYPPFSSLCLLSAFTTVVWNVLLYGISQKFRNLRYDKKYREYRRRINEISKRKRRVTENEKT